MLTKLALAAVLILGTASASMAKDDYPQGGYRVGPYGQVFGGRSSGWNYGGGYNDYGFAYAPRHHHWRHHEDRR
jgi:hypothetical protein